MVVTMTETPLIIIGAGEAGVAAAAAIRETHAGPIVLVNGEAELPYERPPLSKDVLMSDAPETKKIRPEAWYKENAIELISGQTVTSINPATRSICLGGGAEPSTLAYSKLLLTTGACVRRLPGPDLGVRYLRTFEDGLLLKADITQAQSLLVIGAGVIGLEVASSARRLGLAVTVVDIAERLMARAVAPEVSAILLDLHRAAGVDVRLGVGSVDLKTSPEGPALVLADGTQLRADIIVAGIGVTPDTRLAASAGCTLDNGVVVDGHGRTTIEGIYAAGDVAAFHHPVFGRSMRVEAWQHAGRHGAHVGRAMVGVADDYCEVPWFWSDQFDLNLQVAGIVADVDETVWRGAEGSRTGFHFARGRLAAVTTLNNGRDMRPATKLIAAGYAGDPLKLIDTTLPLGKIVNAALETNAVAAAGSATPKDSL